MTLHRVAEILIYLGLIGAVEFAALAFSARQLGGLAIASLQRRLGSPLVRHAQPLAAVSTLVLVAGIVLS